MDIDLILYTLADNGDFATTEKVLRLPTFDENIKNKELKELGFEESVIESLVALSPFDEEKRDHYLGRALSRNLLKEVSQGREFSLLLHRVKHFEVQLSDYLDENGGVPFLADVYKAAAITFSDMDDPDYDLIKIIDSTPLRKEKEKCKKNQLIKERTEECVRGALGMLFISNYTEDFEEPSAIVNSWNDYNAPKVWLETFIGYLDFTIDEYYEREDHQTEIFNSLTSKLNELTKMYDQKSVSTAFHKKYGGNSEELIERLQTESVIGEKPELPKAEQLYDSLLNEYEKTGTDDAFSNLKEGIKGKEIKKTLTQKVINWFKDCNNLADNFFFRTFDWKEEIPEFFDEETLKEEMTAYLVDGVENKSLFQISRCFELPKTYFDLTRPKLSDIKACYDLKEKLSN